MMVCPAPLLINTTGSTHVFPGTPKEEVQTITNREEAASMATIISLAANLASSLKRQGSG
jgi:hypothetical protein